MVLLKWIRCILLIVLTRGGVENLVLVPCRFGRLLIRIRELLVFVMGILALPLRLLPWRVDKKTIVLFPGAFSAKRMGTERTPVGVGWRALCDPSPRSYR